MLLVIDDEPNICVTLQECLQSAELRVITANTGNEGLSLVDLHRPAAVLLDVRLPDMTGLDVFAKIRELDARVPVIMMTAFAKTQTAIEAMSRGAFDYLIKPVDFTHLRGLVDRALAVSRMNRVAAVVTPTGNDDPLTTDQIVGMSPEMQEVYKTIGRVAQQDATVLIQGESGTGKELVARAVFHYSRRADKPFLAINCAALSESLLESELFGHERGAFTGADQRRIGKFEQVNGGTIFLDEIGDMSPATQAKALRLLQQQQFERLGGNETIQTDVRIIAATNRDLRQLVAEGKFRQDLLYRLNGFTIELPPLRQRKSDIPALAEYFVRFYNSELGKSIRHVSPAALEQLAAHDWPATCASFKAPSATRWSRRRGTSSRRVFARELWLAGRSKQTRGIAFPGNEPSQDRSVA